MKVTQLPAEWRLLKVVDGRMKKWYIVNDFYVLNNIIWYNKFNMYLYKGIDIWLPKMCVNRLIGGIWTNKKEEIIPGYILVASDKGFDYIRKVLDVELLSFSGDIKHVNDGDVEILSMYENVSFYYLENVYKYGDEIKIKESVKSSYCGMNGKFICKIDIKNGFYARVCVNFCKQKMYINIPYDYVEGVCIKGSIKKIQKLEKYQRQITGTWIKSYVRHMIHGTR